MLLTAARRAVLILLVITLVAFAFALGMIVNGDQRLPNPARESRSPSPQRSGTDPNFGVLTEIYRILNTDFVDREHLDADALFEASINGLLKALNDPHTLYIDPEHYRIGRNDLRGTFEGIGATVSQQGQEIVIVAPIRGSPAEAAGIRAGDVIVAVNGESTRGWTVNQAVLKIRGPKGTKVTLTVRHADGAQEDISIVRDRINVSSVFREPPSGQLRDANGGSVEDIGYVYISEFTERTPQELQPVLKEIAAKNPKGVIIDVRSNPGGLLNTTVEVADLFLERGLILVEVNKDGAERTFNARPGRDDFPAQIPIVVLVDKASASGAEVMAAALRDNRRATIIGETTFGKGTVNNVRELSNGGALYVSIARWLTPLRQQIEGVGLKPDLVVSLSEEDIQARRDVQLFRAIEYLRGQTAQSPGQATPSGN